MRKLPIDFAATLYIPFVYQTLTVNQHLGAGVKMTSRCICFRILATAVFVTLAWENASAQGLGDILKTGKDVAKQLTKTPVIRKAQLKFPVFLGDVTFAAEDKGQQYTDVPDMTRQLLLTSLTDLKMFRVYVDPQEANEAIQQTGRQLFKIDASILEIRDQVDSTAVTSTKGTHQGSTTAVSVSMIVTLSDPASGEVISSTPIEGNSRSLTADVLLAKSAIVSQQYTGSIAKAISDAVGQISAICEELVGSRDWIANVIEVVDESTVYIDRGELEGVTIGTTLEFGSSRDLLQKGTNKVIGQRRDRFGILKVHAVQGEVAECRVVENADNKSITDEGLVLMAWAIKKSDGKK